MSVYLSRARLKSETNLAALAPILVPSEEGARIGASHRLVWSLFADGPKRKRDFLWHEEAPGAFLILSTREPSDPHGFFELEAKSFEPRLATGDRLAFFLRANPVVTTSKPDANRGRRHDIVMAAIHSVVPGERARRRAAALGWTEDDPECIPRPPIAWIERQGRTAGFKLEQAAVLAYRQIRIPRSEAPKPRRDDIRFATVDLEGTLVVVEPDRFQAAIRRGFGKAKAFGLAA